MLNNLKNIYQKIQKRPSNLPSSKPIDRFKLYDYYVMRPLSFLPTLILYKLNLSANFASWTGFVILICSAIGFILLSPRYYFILAIMVNISFIFDHIDGNLARLYNKTNHYGKFLDGSLSTIGDTFLIGCIGFKSYLTSQSELFIIIATLLIVWLTLIGDYLYARYRYTFLEIKLSLLQSPISDKYTDSNLRGGLSNNFIRSIREFYVDNMTLVKFLSLLFFAGYNLLAIYVYVYFGMISIYYLPTIIYLLTKTKDNLNYYRSV